ncbi:MAG: ATP-binding protein [Hyphomicrobiaceae bacterium]
MTSTHVVHKDSPEVGDRTPKLDTKDRVFLIGLVVVVLSVISALATYLILTNLTPITPRNDVVLGALLINIALIIAMVAMVTHQIRELVLAWRNNSPGARLHIRIVALFSILAALPALLLAIGATLSFSRTLDTWFVSRTRAIIDNSRVVAEAYVNENAKLIRTDVLNMARDIDSAANLVRDDKSALRALVISHAGLRDLQTAHVISEDGKMYVRGIEAKKLKFLKPSGAAMAEAKAGQTPLGSSKNERISAIAKLEQFPGLYIYVSRPVNPELMGYLQLADANVREYNQLRKRRGGLKLAHGLMYLTISMTGLLAAIWSGMWFAGRFVAPIRRLIGASQEVSTGNLDVALPERRGEGDLRRLSQTFNTMTRKLKNQRDALVHAGEEKEERRRFTEAVLQGVSAGVIGLDSHDKITLMSRSASELLSTEGEAAIGKSFNEALPNFAPQVMEGGNSTLQAKRQKQVTLTIDGEERTFAVRVTKESEGEGDVGSVVTFDDITELVSAQRTSAWADVAQRIAHEIKNPLTPIQLSAERIKRKYGKVIEDDKDTFDKLTDTIVRQVGDLKTMVDEFASFARMPTPVVEHHDLRDAIQEPVLLFREGHPAIDYILTLPDTAIMADVDRRLISQAVTNLVKNATESVESVQESGDRGGHYKPTVATILSRHDGYVTIEVIDNGPGLPAQNRSRLLEPYVTNKGHKGTGLGLAMVKKITEQHGGTLSLSDAPDAGTENESASGARVVMTLPLQATIETSETQSDETPALSGDEKTLNASGKNTDPDARKKSIQTAKAATATCKEDQGAI